MLKRSKEKRGFNFGLCASAMVLLMLIISLGIGVSANANEAAEAVWGDFNNSLKVPGQNPDHDKSSSATFFGGHVKSWDDPQVPQGAGIRIVASSFGQAAASVIPYPDFQTTALDESKKMLFFEHADNPLEAALRYKVLLYQSDETGISAQFKSMADMWTEADRERAEAAAKLIRDALRHDPLHSDLRNALLDIYYDIAVADFAKAEEMMVEAQKAALGAEFGYIAGPGEFLISEEIRLIQGDPDGGGSVGALELYDQAIVPYFELLKDPMGIDMIRVDPAAAAANMPFGYYLFYSEVPQRSLFAPSYKDDSGSVKPVVEDPSDPDQPAKLFDGYKDLVLMFKMERAAAGAAAKLARLLVLRGDSGDADNAREVIGKSQQKAYTDGSILDGIFPAPDLQGMDANSGLIEARASWAQGLSALSGVKSFLDGNANPLGFAEDFLALQYTLLPSGQQQFSDTYQYFADLLFPDNAPGGQLLHALDTYQEAVTAYENLQIYKEQMQGELDNIRDECSDRLREIFGKTPADADYYTADATEGCEIWTQIKNVELAGLRIEHNGQEIKNLRAQIENEIERRGKEHGISNLISQTYIEYGDKRAKITEGIGAINAAQAAAEAMGRSGASWFTSMGASVATSAANAAIQFAGEIAKGFLEAKKDRYAAEENARIQFLNDQISAAESEARVKDLYLGMSILSIESAEAAIVLAQEFGKLKALYDEKAYLETRWEEADGDLATRYYADPAHRIISNARILKAGIEFENARYWIYMMARALDYRLNRRFAATSVALGDDWSYTSQSVFKLRNALELEDMVRSMHNHAINESLGDRAGHTFVKYSLREDFLGFRIGPDPENQLRYPDPATGELVDATEAFKSYLKHVAVNGPSDHLDGFNQVVRLEFSTVGENFEGTFFSDGRWNEKIKWLAVKIYASLPQYDEVQIYIEQSGTAFVRNETRGTQPDPDRPDIIEGEMTAYPIRHWFYKDGKWESKPEFGFSSLFARITEDPDVPDTAWQSAEFHELSPAVTKWVLEIPTWKQGLKVVDLDQLNDIEIWFYNYYIARN